MIAIGIPVAALLWMGMAYSATADGEGWKRGAWVGSNGWYVLFGVGVLSLVNILVRRRADLVDPRHRQRLCLGLRGDDAA